MKRSQIGLFVLLFVAGGLRTSFGEVRTEVGEDGRTYQVTTWQQSVPVTELESRTQTVYQPQTTTQVQAFQQTYAVPVTEYRMVSRYRGWWNPFSPPYWTHTMEPVTRWEHRTATVQLPATQTQSVPAQQTVQVPVTKYRTVENMQKVAISAPAGSTPPSSLGSPQPTTPMVATRTPTQTSDGRYGAASERLTSDPPAGPSQMAGAAGSTVLR